MQTLQENVASLVRLEVDRVRQELSDTARRAGRASALLGGAGMLGVVTIGTSVAFGLRTLDVVLPRPAAAALLTGLCGAGAGVLAGLGIAEMRRAMPLLPKESLQSLRNDAQAAGAGAVEGATPPAS